MEQGNCRLGEGGCSANGPIVRGMCPMHYGRWRKIQHANGGLPPQGPSPKFIDRTGLRCGLLTVIARAPSRRSAGVLLTYWLCRCDCGNEIEVRSVELAYPETSRPGKRLVKSCGCLKHKGYPLPGGRAGRNRVLRYHKQGADKRGLSWDLSDDEFDRLISQPCHYCGQPPSVTKASRESSPFPWNGIDRVDSGRGYAPENVVPCCTQCNKAKGDMSYDEFRVWVARLLDVPLLQPRHAAVAAAQGLRASGGGCLMAIRTACATQIEPTFSAVLISKMGWT